MKPTERYSNSEPELPLFLDTTELLKVCIKEFNKLNKLYFNSKLEIPIIEFSNRMTTTAGKCYPKLKKIRLNIKHYHKDGLEEFLRTFRHECIHLVVPNHGSEFKKYAEVLDVDVHWNNAPARKTKPWQFWSFCSLCGLFISKKVKREKITYCPHCKKKRGLLVPMKYRRITQKEKRKYGIL